MNKIEKQQSIENMRSIFTSYDIMVLAHNNGLTVAAAGEIRKSVKGISGKYFIAKNTLAKLAVVGTKYEGMASFFSGPIAIACANDPVEISKAIIGFCKSNEKLKLIGGAIGKENITAEQIGYLATLPSLDSLRGKLIGLLNAPAQKMLAVLQAPGAQIARVLRAYSEKDASV